MQTICPKCNSKWETEAKVEKCPFCGVLLNIDQENLHFDSVRDALKHILSERGAEIITNPDRVISFLLDVYHMSDIEKNILKATLSSSTVHNCVLNHKFDIDDQKKTVYYLMDTYGMSDAWAWKSIGWIAYALDSEASAVGSSDRSEQTRPSLQREEKIQGHTPDKNERKVYLNEESVRIVQQYYLIHENGKMTDRGFIFGDNKILISVLHLSKSNKDMLVYADADYPGKNYLELDVQLTIEECRFTEGGGFSTEQIPYEEYRSVRKYLGSYSGAFPDKPILVDIEHDSNDFISRGLFDKEIKEKYLAQKNNKSVVCASTVDNWVLMKDGTLYVGYISKGVVPGNETREHARLGKEIDLLHAQNVKKVVFDDRIEKIADDFAPGFKNLLLVVHFPKNLREIGNNAFRETGIYILIFPNGCKEIGQSAFEKCNNLDLVPIGSIEIIHSKAFAECEKLFSIIGIGKLKSIGNRAFYGCKSLRYFAVLELEQKIKIGYEAFGGCDNLEKKSLVNRSTVRIDIE